MIYRKLIKLLLLVIALTVSAQTQKLNIVLKNDPFPLIGSADSCGFAASVFSEIYSPGIGLNLQGEFLGEDAHTLPELLILNEFIYKKDGNKDGLYNLYDSNSQPLLSKIININSTRTAYNNFSDFELLSKNEFGSLIRIRYSLITNSGKRFPWVSMIVKINDQYFLTQSIPINNIFIQTSSGHPYNHSRELYKGVDTKEMFRIIYKQISDSVINIVDDYDDTKNITLFFNINKYDTSLIKINPPAEVNLLFNMINNLRDDKFSEYKNLWSPLEREELISSEGFLPQYQLHQDFYKDVDSIELLGNISGQNEKIILFRVRKKDLLHPLQMLFVEKVQNELYLKSGTKQYYAGRILERDDVRNQLLEFLKN